MPTQNYAHFSIFFFMLKLQMAAAPAIVTSFIRKRISEKNRERESDGTNILNANKNEDKVEIYAQPHTGEMLCE